jgi:hypothetical protein
MFSLWPDYQQDYQKEYELAATAGTLAQRSSEEWRVLLTCFSYMQIIL